MFLCSRVYPKAAERTYRILRYCAAAAKWPRAEEIAEGAVRRADNGLLRAGATGIRSFFVFPDNDGVALRVDGDLGPYRDRRTRPRQGLRRAESARRRAGADLNAVLHPIEALPQEDGVAAAVDPHPWFKSAITQVGDGLGRAQSAGRRTGAGLDAPPGANPGKDRIAVRIDRDVR